jgi:TolB-like protein/catechol 2,3-dioxygenase-like lactoylglutathione lyase family enzyme
MSLFAELKRRNVLRVAAAYVAVSWLLIQVVETLFPVFGLSDAAIRTVVIVLAIGFVPAIVVAWAFELTPEGFVRDSDVDRNSPLVRARARRLDRIVMVALALAVGYFAFDKFMLEPARDEALAEAAKQEGRAEAAQQDRATGQPVVAVLPFTAVTDTEDSAFFAAGVHDDLLTKLAQQPAMLVVSRTSVMKYAEVEHNILEIGAALGADAILEGGVQSAGDRIRINAQLIDAQTDEHLWAETYDRELTTASIFDIQDDIAHAIAEAMHVTLVESAGSPIPTDNMPAYRAYHEALAVRDAEYGAPTSEEYRALLRRAADLDPGFTRPLALLVGSYALEAFSNEDDPEVIARAESTLQDIREKAPDSVDYVVAQTLYTYYILKEYRLAHELATRALERVPSDTGIIEIKSWIEQRLGDFEARVESLRLARQLEPDDPTWTVNVIYNLMLLHRYDDAMAEVESYGGRDQYLAFMRATLGLREHGDLQRTVEDMLAVHEEFGTPTTYGMMIFAHELGRNFEAAARAAAAIPDAEAQMVRLEIWHFLGEEAKVAELAAAVREDIVDPGMEPSEITDGRAIDLALLAATEGDAAATEQFIRQFYRGEGTDWASRVALRDRTCRILGMAGAAEAAVKCIRDGLAEPSRVMPFLEPRLPHYDAIREEPVFVALLEELELENSEDR